MKQVILLSLLILLTISCGRTSKQNQNAEMQTETQTEVQPIEQITGTISETQKFEMFCTALANHSTAPNFVVVTVKNLNTGEVKEICTEAPFLNGAIYRQTGKFSYSTNCKDYPNRYFEFSADSALWNISFDLYAISELEKYAKNIDINSIVQQIKNGTLREKTFGLDDGQTFDWEKTHKEQRMFAHLMFNNGVMMTRGCEAGNISSLKYFEQKDE
jgi:predicted lactoylglutathione lyase